MTKVPTFGMVAVSPALKVVTTLFIVRTNCVTVRALPSISESLSTTFPVAAVFIVAEAVSGRAVGASFTGFTLIEREPSVVSAGL